MNERRWYYLATLSRYVLEQCDSLAEAEAKGKRLLGDRFVTCRLALPEEIGLMAFNANHEREEARLLIRRLVTELKLAKVLLHKAGASYPPDWDMLITNADKALI